MADEIEDALLEAATGPRRARDKAGEFESHDLEQLAKIADRAKANSGVTKNHFGLRFAKLQPPSAG